MPARSKKSTSKSKKIANKVLDRFTSFIDVHGEAVSED